MKIINVTLILLMIVFVGINCSNDEEEGGGGGSTQFSCKLNGILWEPSSVEGSVVAQHTSSLNAFNIYTYKGDPNNPQNNETFTIMIYHPKDSTFTIGGVSMTSAGFFNYTDKTHGYATNSTHIITFKITTYDKTNKVARGTFSGKVVDGDGNEINVTDGKFDVKMNVF